MASVQLQNISKTYPGGVEVVKNLNLDIKHKEFVVLVGPSGCGKSTTLRMIAGLEDITTGKLSIDGMVVNDILPKNRDIAMVFQNYALYPHMTVYENMAFGLKIRKLPKPEIQRCVLEAAYTLGIEDLLDRKPKALSGGQRQRVALGRAMVRQPKVFLLDEPLSNLDAKLRDQMRTEIRKLHQKLQTTFIYVTHDQREAMTMGTRIVVMKDGIVQQVDTPQQLYGHPCNLFVAGFLGSPQMNFFKVTVTQKAAVFTLDFADESLVLPPVITNNPKLKEYIGKEIIMGIRPEDLYDDANALKEANAMIIKGSVDVIELMGAETYLFMKIADSNVVARVSPKTKARTGETIEIVFDMDKIHLFDQATEKTILN
ncbi:multiple sugar transport system ATP-binding protein [Propionispira arboris]|uniref:Multiple sugar transport system ATP-binding protein n=1 Tax=Propionispira arboris TaxID=84035 RepID=A0A1H6TLN6_9FIRM|nr:sn-glycerol-3-phosphate ABC transporter ATP-binding protein UgpC [Propionispira arboris]SEI80978.1 multiple sugar transport system ATP-binding protein [Propionispira arboris]